MTTSANFVTPTARMVWGDAYKPQDKDADGKPLMIKSGPNAGQPRVQYAFGIAIPKEPGHSHWSQTTWGAIIWGVGHASAPQAAQSPAFAWKVTDGDSQMPNKKGKKPSEREGYPGCWVLSLGSSFAPRIVNRDGSAAILDPGAVKAGYYVQVSGTVAGNDSSQNPGVFLNHNYVSLQGYGPEILTGPDPSTLGFGAGAAPAGMSAQPPGGFKPPAAPGAPPPPAAAAPPAYAPPPVGAPPPPVAVAPAPSFLAPPAPPVYAPPAPAAPAQQMTAKAAGASYAAMIAAGWTDAALRAHGYMI